MTKPLSIDLFCGLGGWTEGLLAEGYYVVGFDIEKHVYGEHRYPAQLVLQDVMTLHGSQFRDAALIVASPPCQAYSYRAMPWKRAKALPPPDNTLFNECFRIQREACEAAGRHIPLIVENVRGAQPWVGRARWNYGSFYLWGDVPALMPMTLSKPAKMLAHDMSHIERDGEKPQSEKRPDAFGWHKDVWQDKIRKNNGGSWFAVAHNTTSGKGQNPDGRKQPGIGGQRNNGKGDAWFQDGAARHGSKSSARKFASAMIAKIPLPLSRYIAATFKETPPAGVLSAAMSTCRQEAGSSRPSFDAGHRPPGNPDDP